MQTGSSTSTPDAAIAAIITSTDTLHTIFAGMPSATRA